MAGWAGRLAWWGWNGGTGIPESPGLYSAVFRVPGGHREPNLSHATACAKKEMRETCAGTHAHWELVRLYGPLSLLLPLAVWMCNLLFYLWERQKNHMQQGWAVVSGRAAGAAAPPGEHLESSSRVPAWTLDHVPGYSGWGGHLSHTTQGHLLECARGERVHL